MLALAATGAAEGLWLRAERQTAGRGRQGRDWVSPPGNLHATTLVRLRPGDPAPAGLALVAAVALDEVVGLILDRAGWYGPRLLKWPNDLLIEGAKLSGILLERGGDAIVIGFGVNLGHHPVLADRRTTSLAALGVTVAVDAFLNILVAGFAAWLARWRSEGLAPVRRRWLERAHPIGTALTARLPDGGSVDGLFDGLDGDGTLLLRLASGERRVIHAGDVLLL